MNWAAIEERVRQVQQLVSEAEASCDSAERVLASAAAGAASARMDKVR